MTYIVRLHLNSQTKDVRLECSLFKNFLEFAIVRILQSTNFVRRFT